MLNAIIIEDEKPAMEALVNNLSEVTPKVNVKARLHTVKESINYFSGETEADIIFSDTGYYARAATCAGIQINAHSPLHTRIIKLGVNGCILNEISSAVCHKDLSFMPCSS